MILQFIWIWNYFTPNNPPGDIFKLVCFLSSRNYLQCVGCVYTFTYTFTCFYFGTEWVSSFSLSKLMNKLYKWQHLRKSVQAEANLGPWVSAVSPERHFLADIVDIKPANMEDLTEVITAAEFHPHHCNLFVYSSSKGTLRLCDMREAALCDKHSKCE